MTDDSTKKAIKDAVFHQKILDSLKHLEKYGEEIKQQVIKTNGRVTDLEQQMLLAKKDIAEAFKLISPLTFHINKYKSEEDNAKDELIVSLKKRLDVKEADEKGTTKKWLILLSLGILFLLLITDMINPKLLDIIFKAI